MKYIKLAILTIATSTCLASINPPHKPPPPPPAPDPMPYTPPPVVSVPEPPMSHILIIDFGSMAVVGVIRYFATPKNK